MDIIFGILFALACVVIMYGYFHFKDKNDDLSDYLGEAEESASFWYARWAAEVADNVELYNDLEALRQEHIDLGLNYDAATKHYKEDLTGLEVGTQEIEENYQQELLTEYDKVADLCKLVGSLEEIRLDHNVHCLPRLGEDFYPNDEDDEAPVYEELALTWKW